MVTKSIKAVELDRGRGCELTKKHCREWYEKMCKASTKASDGSGSNRQGWHFPACKIYFEGSSLVISTER